MIIGALLAVSLAACGNDTDNAATPPAGNETTNEGTNTAEQNAAVPTLDELLAKTGKQQSAEKLHNGS